MTTTTMRTWIRPNVDVPFYSFPTDLTTYVNDTYDKTGKRISLEISRSEDSLTSTTTSVWSSGEAFAEFLNDPVIIESGAKVNLYNESNQITQILGSPK